MKAPHQKNARWLGATGLIVLFATVLFGCSPTGGVGPITVKETVVVQQQATTVVEKVVTATPEPPKLGQGNTLVIASTAASQVEPFSPLFCNSGYCFIPMNTLLLGLTIHDDKGQPVPAIAEKWESNATSDVWTFHINPNAVWSDGEPITANDVVWTYTTGLHPDTGGNMLKQANLLQIKGAKDVTEGKADSISGIKAVDDKTVEFTLEGPSATFVNEVWHGIVPAHMLKDVPYAEMKTNPFNVNGPTVVSGPLKLVKRDGDQIFELAKNEKYWDKPVQFDSVIVKALNDDVAAAQAEAGEIEYGRIPASEFKRLSEQPQLDTVLSNVDLFYDWVVNTRKPYLQDKRVRQALSYILDRQAILDYAWEGNGKIVVPPFAPDWAVNSDLNTYATNLDKAKQLLEEAGWDPNQKIVLMVGPWPDNVKPAEITHAQWTAAGLNVEIRLIAGSAWSTEMQGNDWDIGMIGGFYGTDPSQFANDFACGGFRAKVTGWCSEDLDKLAVQGVSTTDTAERKKIYDQIGAIVNDEMPQIPLYATGTPWVVNKGLKGVKPPGNWFFMTWNIADWSR